MKRIGWTSDSRQRLPNALTLAAAGICLAGFGATTAHAQAAEAPGRAAESLATAVGTPGGGTIGVVLDRSAFPQSVVAFVDPKSPAATAGIKAGDRIVAIHGAPVESARQLMRAVARADIGSEFPITYRRGDREFEAIVGVVPFEAVFDARAARRGQEPAIGIRVAPDALGRVVVTAIRKDSPAAMAGLQVGDRIVAVQGVRVATPAHLAAAIDLAEIGERIELVYRRGDVELRATPRVVPHTQLFGHVRGLGGERPAIGLRLRETDEGDLVTMGVVPGSPADMAGLRAGDIILAVNGVGVDTDEAFSAAIDRQRIGSPVEIQYQRDGWIWQADAIVGDHVSIYGPPSQQGRRERQVMRQPQDLPETEQFREPGRNRQTAPPEPRSPAVEERPAPAEIPTRGGNGFSRRDQLGATVGHNQTEEE